MSTWHPPAPAVRAGPGLRSRVIVGFVSVSVVTAVITALTGILGSLIYYATGDINTTRLAPLNRYIVERGLSRTTVVWLLALATAGLLLMSVVSGWLFARRMLRPVQRLAQAADRVAGGDLGIRLFPSGSDELAQLAHTFNTMTANLARSMQELRRLEAQSRRFAADVSHELRTPLAAMIAVSDVLADQAPGPSPNAARAARLVIQEISHLDRLVNDLIEMSRFDAGTAVLDTDVIDIATAVRTCLGQRGWADRVTVRVQPGLVAELDRRRFDVILANLVGNAVKYGAPPIEVDAVQHGPGSALVITVSDRGPGLPVAALPHVFERFYKADGARTRSDGSGLGLAIAAENARLHGGDITAGNRPDGGALFRLELPAFLHADRTQQFSTGDRR